MNKLLLTLAFFLGYSFAACADKVTEVDVAIIGGGAAGVYAATRLLDYNKTVVVLENKDLIGGQTETYFDPATGVPVNVGVKVFSNTTATVKFLAHYDFPMSSTNISDTLATDTVYVDFNTSTILPNFTLPSAQAQAAALSKYSTELAKYPDIMFGYNLPSPVPDDLLLPFGEFMEKYELDDAVNMLFEFNHGFTPLLEVPTLYVLKYLNPIQLQSILESSFIVAANGDSHTLYDNAAKVLGKRVLYGVSGLEIDRHHGSGPVTISVGGSKSGPSRISAKKLVVAIPPTTKSLKSIGLDEDMDATELELFGKLIPGSYYILVVKNSGITANLRNRHTPNKYSLPTFPAIYSIIQQAGSEGLTMVYYGTLGGLDAAEVEARVISDIERLPSSLRSNSTAVPEVVRIVDHTYNVMAPPEDIKQGYYTSLEALQGVKNTWYIGMAWATQSSSVIWEGLEKVFLPAILATF
ncbi:Beta-cyclopiazonate dehydrogenase [Paramyrothecium foliicola]|nr:Beta-cyclopiazonate dehydrogenase [Paramyrothecium foliicola]